MSNYPPDYEDLEPEEVLRLYGMRPRTAKKLADRIKAAEFRRYADVLENHELALVWDRRDFVYDVREWANSIEREA